MNTLYLASASPRRQELLKSIGVSFELLAPGADEDAEALETPPHARLAFRPEEYAQWAADQKLSAASKRLKARGLEEGRILSADTVVALGREVLGKPQDEAEAGYMLMRLSGREHEVFTAMSYYFSPFRNPVQRVVRTRVSFMELSEAQITNYVASGEPFGKAGAYAIQGLGASLVASVQGSLTNVIGLPLEECRQLLGTEANILI
jgi:septum formation protein